METSQDVRDQALAFMLMLMNDTATDTEVVMQGITTIFTLSRENNTISTEEVRRAFVRLMKIAK